MIRSGNYGYGYGPSRIPPFHREREILISILAENSHTVSSLSLSLPRFSYFFTPRFSAPLVFYRACHPHEAQKRFLKQIYCAHGVRREHRTGPTILHPPSPPRTELLCTAASSVPSPGVVWTSTSTSHCIFKPVSSAQRETLAVPVTGGGCNPRREGEGEKEREHVYNRGRQIFWPARKNRKADSPPVRARDETMIRLTAGTALVHDRRRVGSVYRCATVGLTRRSLGELLFNVCFANGEKSWKICREIESFSILYGLLFSFFS